MHGSMVKSGRQTKRDDGMTRLNHLLSKIQKMEQGATKDAVVEMYEILEWFYDMIEKEDEE